MMLAVTASLDANGLLRVTGTDGPDKLTISASGQSIVVNLGGTKKTFPKSEVHSLLVGGRAGEDTILAQQGVDVPATLRGGEGQDEVIGFYKETQIITEYDDSLALPSGGRIQYQWEGPGPEPLDIKFSVGASKDIDGFIGVGFGVSFTANPDIENGDIDSMGTGLVYEHGLKPVVLGFRSVADDVACASDYPITLDLGGGNDTVRVGGANGPQPGAVTVLGGNGNDSLAFQRTSDVPPNVFLSGGNGNDTVSGGPGTDSLYGGKGNDLLDGAAGNDVAYGGAGDDTIMGGGGDDTLFGAEGDDSLSGGSGNDVLWGAAGKDSLIGGAGKDSLLGQSGDDLLSALDGEKDFLDGGGGMDRARRDDGPSVFDVVRNIESFIP
jgi:Ca2+-binding RTX toxin-like protein